MLPIVPTWLRVSIYATNADRGIFSFLPEVTIRKPKKVPWQQSVQWEMGEGTRPEQKERPGRKKKRLEKEGKIRFSASKLAKPKSELPGALSIRCLLQPILATSQTQHALPLVPD